jgi:hypothetical protein
VDDEELLARAEEALTEIKVNQGLSERHASVLAALRIRLKGTGDKSLEEMLEAADDPRGESLDAKIAEEAKKGKSKATLDDLLSQERKKPEWPG